MGPNRIGASAGELFLQVKSRFWAATLDRRLAGEAEPHSSSLLETRARQLASGRARRSVAAGLELALRRRDPSERQGPIPMNRAAIRTAAPALETLIARLTDREEVSPQGVAIARTIVGDGAGPLYRPRAGTQLLDLATRARAALDRGPRA